MVKDRSRFGLVQDPTLMELGIKQSQLLNKTTYAAKEGIIILKKTLWKQKRADSGFEIGPKIISLVLHISLGYDIGDWPAVVSHNGCFKWMIGGDKKIEWVSLNEHVPGW